MVHMAPYTPTGEQRGLWVTTTQGVALLMANTTTYADKVRVLERWISQLDRYGV